MKSDNGKTHSSVAMVIVILLIIMTFFVVFWINSRQESQTDSEEEIVTLYGDESLCIDADVDKALSNYRMIEIAGIDNGNRSDVMFVVVIDKTDNRAKLFTVYRDTLMKIDAAGKPYKVSGYEFPYYKCNRGYKMGGYYGSMKMLNSHLDLNIREFLGLDWTGIEILVDRLGGINVDITSGVRDRMNGALEGENRIANTGEQLVNGAQAVQYLRCRKDPGSDATTRSHRNEEVLVQVFDKIKSMSTSEQLAIYDDIADMFRTNMSRTTVTDTLASLSKMEVTTCDGFPYNYDIMWDKYNAYYYYVPTTSMQDEVIALHAKVFGQESYSLSRTAADISEELNAYKETMHK